MRSHHHYQKEETNVSRRGVLRDFGSIARCESVVQAHGQARRGRCCAGNGWLRVLNWRPCSTAAGKTHADTMHASAHARTGVRRINSSVFARVPVVRTLHFERIMLRPPFLLQPAPLHRLAAPASACLPTWASARRRRPSGAPAAVVSATTPPFVQR